MSYPHFILFTCVAIFTQSLSDGQPQELHLDNQHTADTSEISEENLDYEQLNKEKWVESHNLDPHDMFGLSIEQLKELLAIKTSGLDTSSNTIDSNKNDAASHTDNSKEKVSTVPDASNCQQVNLEKEQKGFCTLDSNVTRWVKMLLYRIERESDKESIAISFILDSTIMENLRDIANTKLFKVSAFDGIISNLLAQAVITRKESFASSHAYLCCSDTLQAFNSFVKKLFDNFFIKGLIILILLLAMIKINVIFTSWIFSTQPQRERFWRRVGEILTFWNLKQTVHELVPIGQIGYVEDILPENNTVLTQVRNPAEEIQCNSNDEALNNPHTDSQTTPPNVIADELATESCSFGKSPCRRYSEPEIDISVKESPILPIAEKIPERLAIEDNTKIETLYDEVSNLPESLSDSFEVLSTDDDNDDSMFCNKSYTFPNCDTSLSEMQCSCKLCR